MQSLQTAITETQDKITAHSSSDKSDSASNIRLLHDEIWPVLELASVQINQANRFSSSAELKSTPDGYRLNLRVWMVWDRLEEHILSISIHQGVFVCQSMRLAVRSIKLHEVSEEAVCNVISEWLLGLHPDR